MCKVSVLMPTYNAEKYLSEAVESILNQTFSDFELIVIDDASKDKTCSILESYHDSRIKILQGPCRGIAAALNLGLDNAKGEYVARMDADDISLPRRFEKQVKFLDIHPEIGLCSTLAMMFTKDGDYQLFGTKHLEHMGLIDQLYDTVVCHPTVMFRRELFNHYGLRYNESFKVAEDQELWTRALRVTKFYGIQEMLLRYRLHNNNASQITASMGDSVVQNIRCDVLKWLYPTGNYDGNLQPKIDSLFKVLDGELFSQNTVNKEKKCVPQIYPAFSESNIPIVTCSSEKYGLYCAVMIHSIVSNSDPKQNYDIVVLTQDMSGETKDLIESIVDNRNNISIRFCYISELLEGYTFHEKEHIPSVTCSRLLIPEIFKTYEKVIWFDVDAVANKDIAELYHIDIGDNLIAAAHDIGMAGGDGSEEMFCALKMSRNEYVNTGIMILNCEELRKQFTSEELLNTAARKDFDNMDQDALNFHCKGKIRYFDMKWNTNATNVNSSYANAIFAEEYRAAVKDPYVVHYIGPMKPWDNLQMPMARYFWKYAAETKCYDLILQRLLNRSGEKDQEKVRIQEQSFPNNWPLQVLSGKRWKRVIVWSLYDRKILKEKVKRKLTRHPILYVIAKAGYKFAKGIKNIFC